MSTYNGGLKGGDRTPHNKTKHDRDDRLVGKREAFEGHRLSGLLSRVLTKWDNPMKQRHYKKMATDTRCVAPTF